MCDKTPEPMGSQWKAELYARYVSTGQAAAADTTDRQHFYAASAPYVAYVIANHLPHRRDIHLLDIGCGNGALVYHLRQEGYANARGVDVSLEQIAIAQRFGVPGVEAGNLLELLRATPSASLDVVTAMDVFEHFERGELLELVREVRRTLGTGGVCIAHVPNGEGLFGNRVRWGDLTHELAFTQSSARQLFFAAGFAGLACYEDRPVGAGLVRTIRRSLWTLGTAYARLLLAAETGSTKHVLSQNMLLVAKV
jgi:2-polyprenyl-3-methyl-5-hydroxy-6-metoxy-1,4-benzoquinol methylase